MNFRWICLLLACLISSSMHALSHGDEPDKQLKLYPGNPPGKPTLKEGEPVAEMIRDRYGNYFNVHEPVLDVYHAKGEGRSGAAVVVCPGGSYGGLAYRHEGISSAKWLRDNGITAVLLRYRMKPYRHPVPMLDVQRALQTARANAEKWGIDPERIGVMGFSAGGHLASTATVYHAKRAVQRKC